MEEEPGIVCPSALIESMVPKAASMVKGNPARSMTRIDKFLSTFKSNEIFRKITLSKLVNILGNMEKRMMDKKLAEDHVNL